MMPKVTKEKIGIIKSVKDSVGLLALALLIIEVILGLLAAKAEGIDFTILIIGMLISIGFILFIIYKKTTSLQPGEKSTDTAVTIKHELFIASPMASFNSEEEYTKERKDILSLIATFRKECNFKSVIYAGKDIATMEDFDAPDISVKEDFDAIKESKFFVMVLPEKLPSSVLVEAGVALAAGKPSLYFVKDKSDLPFLLSHSEMAFDTVKIYEYKTIDDIKKLIINNGKKLLPDTI